MKAITLTQPWAALVAIGAKKIETRSWNTAYRGPLAIHSAKSFPEWAKMMMSHDEFSRAFEKVRAQNLSSNVFHCGFVLATCDLVRVERIGPITELPTSPEYDFGDYRPGRYMFFLENIRRLPTPLSARGALNLWDWTGSGL